MITLEEIKKYGPEVPIATRGDKFSQTPLHFAAKSKCKEIIELLIEHGGDLECTASKNRSVLHFLLDNEENKDPDQEEICLSLMNLLISKRCPVNIKNSEEQTLLHIAARYKQEKILRVLIPLLPKYLDNFDVYSNTVLLNLLKAIKNEDGQEELKFVPIVTMMLEKCPVLVGLRDKHGMSPVHVAAENKQIEIMKILLECYENNKKQKKARKLEKLEKK